jgi:beta-phosphoglucomutase family hydrolase
MFIIDENVKALIFDIDGTLADTMQVHYSAWRTVCEKIGFEYPMHVYNELAGIPTVKIVQILNDKFGLSFDDNTIREKEDAFINMISEIKPIIPVINIAMEYKDKMPISCGTGGRRDIALLTLKPVELENFFNIIVASEDVEHHKPFPDTFLKCAELMKVNPRDCLVFEDGDLGIEAARRAGMKCINVHQYIMQ